MEEVGAIVVPVVVRLGRARDGEAFRAAVDALVARV